MRVQRKLLIRAAILTVIIAHIGCEKMEEHRHEHGEPHETNAHHEHIAPHGGTLVVFGDEFAHIEFVLDRTTGKLTGYVLDGEAEKSVRLSQKTIELKVHREDAETDFTLQLSAIAHVLTGETQGDTSQFEAQSDALKGASEFHAEIVSIEVMGQMFTHIEFEFPEGNEATENKHGGH